MKSLLTFLACTSALRVPAPRMEASPFAPPPALVKPLASVLVTTAKTFPATLPVTHAAMDWLLTEQSIASKQMAVASPEPVATAAPVAAPPAREEWQDKIRRAFSIAGEALVGLLAARLELAFISVRIAIRTRQREALAQMQETLDRVLGAPARIVDTAQSKVAATVEGAEGQVSALMNDVERRRESLSQRVGDAKEEITPAKAR